MKKANLRPPVKVIITGHEVPCPNQSTDGKRVVCPEIFGPRTGLCRRLLLAFAFALLLLPAPLRAQGTRADYERAAKLEEFARAKVAGGKIHPHWFRHDTAFWYRDEHLNGRGDFFVMDTESGGHCAPAFDHARLTDALFKATGHPAEADRLPLQNLRFADDGGSMGFTVDDKRWRLDLATYELREDDATGGDASSDADSLPASLRVRPSLRTGENTTVRFVNRMPGAVKLWWLSPEGETTPYGAIPPGQSYTQHTYGGHVWLITDGDQRTLAVFEATDADATAIIDPTRLPKSGGSGRRRERRENHDDRSPDGAWRSFVRDHNLFLANLRTHEETALTKDGQPGDEYEGEFHWSPDSRRLVVKRTRAAQEHKIYLVESSPKDQVQPKLHTEDYLKPGDRIAQSKPHLFCVPEGTEIPVGDALFPNPWEIDEFHWSPDSKQFTFTYNQRGHQVLRVVGVDAETGEAKALVDDQSKTFIDYSGKRFQRYLDASNELVWMSERDGWNHLYLHDATTGALKNQITRGPWVVRKVDRIDEAKRQIWFQAGGIRPEQNPYYLHHCRVNFDGTSLTILTAGDGDHTVEWSPDGRYLFDTWSRVDQPPVTELRRADDGSLVRELVRGDWAELLQTGWSAPEPFSAKGRDGTTDIYGVIFRPMNFDPARKYPVIENIYAGPQGSFVPRGFQPVYGSQKLAELGFIVVQIDGMGTSDRSKAFHDVCWKNLQDAGLPDRVLWMKAAAAKYPALDLSRVGVYGTSAGGQSALGALLFHGDFYQAGVADCGCHDNRMDKIWWNEQWMGWPVGPEYAEASNVTHAAQLQGKLLLVVGELDRNVDPSSTMQVVNALIKADKDFELLVVPGAGHGATGSPYGERRRNDFFVRSLLGVEPRGK